MSASLLPYRLGVGIMLLNPKREVFVGRRLDTRSEAWQMPQGGIDDGETPEVAAMRELGEEVGTSKARIVTQGSEWLNYDLPEHLIPVIWNGKYRGQKQRWFVMEFLGDDSDINIQTEHPEFIEWKWAKPETLPSLIVPFKQELYRKILDEFSPWL